MLKRLLEERGVKVDGVARAQSTSLDAKTAQERILSIRRRYLEAKGRALGREVPLPERSSLMLAKPFLAAELTPSQELDQRELIHAVTLPAPFQRFFQHDSHRFAQSKNQ